MPPLYVFTGPVVVSSGLTVQTQNVAVYFACGNATGLTTCAADGDKPQLTMQPGSHAHLAAPLTSAAPSNQVLKGLALVFDTGVSTDLQLGGSAGDTVTGTVYGRDITMVGNAQTCGVTFLSMLVVKDMEMQAEGSCIRTTYTTAANVGLPSVTTTTIGDPALRR
jgi:hypothetical protein